MQMTLDFFILTVWAGILATYVHMAFALWAPKYGLPRLDFGRVMADLCFDDSFDGKPPYWLGLVTLHLNGIVFALLYATLAGPLLPGPLFVRGLMWGGILFIGSQLLFVPLFLRHGFFAIKAHPRAWMTAAVVHTIYGAILGWLCPVL
jgi:hypothetical protein